MVQIIETDLIKYALGGNLDVIAHGCNCFCHQGAGIALAMQKTFDTLSFKMEGTFYKGNYNKLGTIDYGKRFIENNASSIIPDTNKHKLIVVNMYTQYNLGKPSPYNNTPLDYNALYLCLQKLDYTFNGKKIGIPYNIGCGLAKGDWEQVYHKILNIFEKSKTELIICKLK